MIPLDTDIHSFSGIKTNIIAYKAPIIAEKMILEDFMGTFENLDAKCSAKRSTVKLIKKYTSMYIVLIRELRQKIL